MVAAFDGRGTPPGVRLAIAAGVLADQSDVSLIEDFDTQTYEVVLEDGAWSPHRSETVRELADLADPSVVQLRDPLQYRLSAAALEYRVGDTLVAPMTSLPAASTRYQVSDTQARTQNSTDTFGTGRFDGANTFS